MLSTVWLRTMLPDMLSDDTHPLAVILQHLKQTFDAHAATIVLMEPADSHCYIIRSSRSGAYVMPNESITDSMESVCSSLENEEAFCTPEGLWVRLRTEKTSVFGYLLLENARLSSLTQESREAVLSFSSLLYDEAMGGIIASTNPTALEVRDLTVEYGSGGNVTRAVNEVNLDICENEFTVIFGSSGCGKTSLLNVLGGMLTPTSGTVLRNGVDVAKMNKREQNAYRRDTIGFVFQHYNLIRDLTAEENINTAASIVKNPYPVQEVLELVGLSGKGNRYPGQLSGGEQQRVCIARALVKRSQLLLCDEPTGALDTENASNIISILQGLVRDLGIPVVMITHNPVFSVLANHMVVMSSGNIIDELRQPFPILAEDLNLL